MIFGVVCTAHACSYVCINVCWVQLWMLNVIYLICRESLALSYVYIIHLYIYFVVVSPFSISFNVLSLFLFHCLSLFISFVLTIWKTDWISQFWTKKESFFSLPLWFLNKMFRNAILFWSIAVLRLTLGNYIDKK